MDGFGFFNLMMPLSDWLLWLRLGATSLGGPAAQIATLEQECVEKRSWLSQEQFSRALGLCMFLPGPEAQQLVAWIAWKKGGWRSAVLATLFFVIPGLLCCAVLAFLYHQFGQRPLVGGALSGARAAVAGIILVMAYRLFKTALFDTPRRAVAGITTIGMFFSAPFAFMAVAAGLYAWYIRPPDEEAVPETSEVLKSAAIRVLRFLIPVGVVFLVLWAIFGHDDGVVKLAEVSLIAVLTSFGGAYAAMGVWKARTVVEYGWFKEPVFGDALVVGEITPGPLLLAGSFIGCMAGYNGSLGMGGGWMAALVGLLVPAIFTFSCSTLILLAAAPLADEGVGDVRFHDVIGLVTAAAAGAVFWLGVSLLLSQMTWVFFLISAAAVAALYLKKTNILLLVALGAAVGWFAAR